MSQNAEADHCICVQLISEKHHGVCRKEYFICSLDGAVLHSVLASFSVAVIKHSDRHQPK